MAATACGSLRYNTPSCTRSQPNTCTAGVMQILKCRVDLNAGLTMLCCQQGVVSSTLPRAAHPELLLGGCIHALAARGSVVQQLILAEVEVVCAQQCHNRSYNSLGFQGTGHTFCRVAQLLEKGRRQFRASQACCTRPLPHL